MAVFEGSRDTPALTQDDLGKAMVEITEVFPSIFNRKTALPLVAYQEEYGGAIKGVTTEEFWLSPPFGRPRNIDYPTLKKLEASEWVQMCVNALVDPISQAEYNIVPRVKGQSVKEWEIDEPLSFLEGLPSEESFNVVLAEMLPDLILYDCGTISLSFPRGSYDENGYLLDDPGKPVDMHVIDGRSVCIEAPPVGGRWKRFWQYSWMSPTSIPTPFDTREMIYLRSRPSSRGVYGMSALELIKNTTNYLLDSTLATSKYWENGMHVGGQIDHPDVTDPDELKLRAKMYKQDLQGPSKYNKWMVTGGNVKITPLQFTPQQMQFLDSQKWFSKVVMGFFKVVPTELGFTEDLNRATGIQQSNIHKSRAIYPLMKLIENAINKVLIWPYFSPNVKFEFRRELDYEDQIKQVQVWASKIQADLISVNEARDEMGKDKWKNEQYDLPASERMQNNPNSAFQMPGNFPKISQQGIFRQEGQGLEQQKKEDTGLDTGLGKAVNVSSPSGQPGFAMVPQVWDGQLVTGATKKHANDFMQGIVEAAEADRKRIVEELKRVYKLE